MISEEFGSIGALCEHGCGRTNARRARWCEMGSRRIAEDRDYGTQGSGSEDGLLYSLLPELELNHQCGGAVYDALNLDELDNSSPAPPE